MALKLDGKLRLGVMTIHRRTEPATGPWLPSIDEMRDLVKLVDGGGYDSLWCGDHISFPAAMLDPFLQLAQAAVVSRRLTLGTSVYLLPLRHPVPVAKQVATLDHLSEGRFIFGVGVGGEFAREYEACGVPRDERGARLTEAIGLLRKLWTGEPVSHEGRFYGAFRDMPMQPPARQPGGPPIWCGGRSDAALRRAGRLADGWIAYAITPEMFKTGLDKIAQAASEVGRGDAAFGTGHLLFTRLDDTYEKALDAATVTLSQRYAALGSPAQVADRIRAFHAAGARHITLDLVGPYEERDRQIAWVARDVLPLLADLR
jgi:probable F420-dependent oxidoreductase